MPRRTGAAGPLPGTGDLTKISQGNQQNNADYNHLIGSGDTSPKRRMIGQRASGSSPATAADIKSGASLRDIKGVEIGTIASVDSDRAVVDTGKTKIRVPLVAFGKDDRGLLLGMTSAQVQRAGRESTVRTEHSEAHPIAFSDDRNGPVECSPHRRVRSGRSGAVQDRDRDKARARRPARARRRLARRRSHRGDRVRNWSNI